MAPPTKTITSKNVLIRAAYVPTLGNTSPRYFLPVNARTMNGNRKYQITTPTKQHTHT